MIRLLGWLAAIVTFPVLALVAVVGFIAKFLTVFSRQLFRVATVEIDPAEYAKTATMDWCNFEMSLASQFELRKHKDGISHMERDAAVKVAQLLVHQTFTQRHLLNEFTRRVACLEAHCLSHGLDLPSPDKADRTVETLQT